MQNSGCFSGKMARSSRRRSARRRNAEGLAGRGRILDRTVGRNSEAYCAGVAVADNAALISATGYGLNGIFWVLRSGAPWRDLHGKDGGAVADMAVGDLRLNRNHGHAVGR